MWPFKKARIVVKTYRDDSPKGLAKKFERDARQMAKSGYIPLFVNDQDVGFFGITTAQVRTVTYKFDRRGR